MKAKLQKTFTCITELNTPDKYTNIVVDEVASNALYVLLKVYAIRFFWSSLSSGMLSLCDHACQRTNMLLA
jgi:hypothetical protein